MPVKKKAVVQLSLKDWINEVGVADVAKLLKIQDAAVRHWRRGANLPSDAMKQKIQKYSRGAVTYSTMIDGFFKARAKKN